jgi:ankyrin repeat protein
MGNNFTLCLFNPYYGKTEEEGKLALWNEVKLGNVQNVQWLIEIFGDNSGIINYKPSDNNVDEHIPLHNSQSAEITYALLGAGATINQKSRNGNTPLILACLESNLEVVQTLLAFKGCDVNAVGKNGKTALLYAVDSPMSDRYEIAKALLAAGADAKVKDNEGKTALMRAEDATSHLKDEMMAEIIKKYNPE